MERQQTFVRSAGPLVRWSIAALAAVGLALVVGAAPALNPGLRADDPYGDWRRVSSAAVFDVARYRFELGVAHLDALVEDALSGASRFEDPAALVDDSVELLEASLRRAPADAQTWAALALAAALRRDGELMEIALRRSWELAPYNAAISGLRLTTLVFVQPESLDVGAAEALRRDVRVMRARQPRNLDALLATSPELRTFLEDSEMTN